MKQADDTKDALIIDSLDGSSKFWNATLILVLFFHYERRISEFVKRPATALGTDNALSARHSSNSGG